jgi:hypothetical protein
LQQALPETRWDSYLIIHFHKNYFEEVFFAVDFLAGALVAFFAGAAGALADFTFGD